MKLTVIFCFLLSFNAFSNDSLVIFNKSKEYHYEALLILPNGDTLTKEKLILAPTGEQWAFQKSQAEYNVFYNTSENAINSVNPVNKRQKKAEKFCRKAKRKKQECKGIWTPKSTSGGIENNKSVWLHAFRGNQYVYTEVAPFPEVQFEQLKIGGEWTSSLQILAGWDNFKGVVNSTYQVIGQVDYSNNNIQLRNCWEIHAIGKHSSLGESKHDFLFNRTNGFVQMNYEFYDGTKISFSMVKVVLK